MNDKSKLLFDECIGWPAVQHLAALLGITGDDVEFGHAVLMGFGGVPDREWIPQIASDGWIIVTGDRGRRGGAAFEKLPNVCQAHGVSFAAFSRSINSQRTFFKIRAIIDVWDELLQIKDAPRGTGYSIRPSSSGHPTLVCYKPIVIDSPKTQQKLELDE